MFVCHVRLTGWLDASVADCDIYVTTLPMLYSNLVDIILKVGFDVFMLSAPRRAQYSEYEIILL